MRVAPLVKVNPDRLAPLARYTHRIAPSPLPPPGAFAPSMIVNCGPLTLRTVSGFWNLAGTLERALLVGAQEADPRNGKISNESPIGRALLGHRIGDQVAAETPNGIISLTITGLE